MKLKDLIEMLTEISDKNDDVNVEIMRNGEHFHGQHTQAYAQI